MPSQRQMVEARAANRCEYCLAPQAVAGYAFHLEHIRPRVKGGEDGLANYALACANCNFAKSNHLTGEDRTTGRQELLFNPRTDKWPNHFRFSRKTFHVSGKTATGRATENQLQLNSARQIEARAFWVVLGVYP